MFKPTSRFSYLVFTFAFFVNISCKAYGDLLVVSELPDQTFRDSSAVAAHGNVIYVSGDGVVAVDISNPVKPEVIMTLYHPILKKCGGLFAYSSTRNGEKRLALACGGTDALVLVDAQNPRLLKTIGLISDPFLLNSASGVVVKSNLAFIAAAGAARVVSIDITQETEPSILSSVRLSASSSLALQGDSCLVVGSGQGNRVSLLTFTPTGVLLKTGSVKDGRLSGSISIVKQFATEPNITIAVTAANDGTFIVLNTTTLFQPVIISSIEAKDWATVQRTRNMSDKHANNRLTSFTDAGGAPYGHDVLRGVVGLELVGKSLAYVARSSGGIAAIDISVPSQPSIKWDFTDDRLFGVIGVSKVGSSMVTSQTADSILLVVVTTSSIVVVQVAVRSLMSSKLSEL